jgi:hypothetical protein
MARMLGYSERAWCPVCRAGGGLYCPDVSRSKKAARAGEKRAWRREAAVSGAEWAEFADEALELAGMAFPAAAEAWSGVAF